MQEEQRNGAAMSGVSDTEPDAGIAQRPDENVDQDGNCISPAYGESVGPNTGEPCDDGRAGGR